MNKIKLFLERILSFLMKSQRGYTINSCDGNTKFLTNRYGLVLKRVFNHVNEFTPAMYPDTFLDRDIERFDFEEYRTFWKKRYPKALELDELNILDVGFFYIDKDGDRCYQPADLAYRLSWIADLLKEASEKASPSESFPGKCGDIERHLATAAYIEITTTHLGPDECAPCWDLEDITHTSVYLRSEHRFSDGDVFYLADALLDVPIAEGDGAAVEYAKFACQLLQVKVRDTRKPS